MYIVTFTALLLLAALAASQACGTVGQTDPACNINLPYCTRYSFGANRCSRCAPGSLMVGGGSCMCDASVHACFATDGAFGSCQPYTIKNKACSNDNDCQVRVNNAVQTGAISESLYCVSGMCKPCSPALWAQFNIGGPSGVFVCAGFSSTLSDQAGRYVTETARPGTSFSCSAAGEIVPVNNTIDLNYGYPGGDRSAWAVSSAGTSTTAAVTTATTQQSTIGSAQQTTKSGVTTSAAVTTNSAVTTSSAQQSSTTTPVNVADATTSTTTTGSAAQQSTTSTDAGKNNDSSSASRAEVKVLAAVALAVVVLLW